MIYMVQRLDMNPQNRTYLEWVHVSSFKHRHLAKSYVKRASSSTQQLRILEEKEESNGEK